MNYLCLDVGTTCTKAQVFNSCGEILFYKSLNCPLVRIDGEEYADIKKIVNTVKELIKLASDGRKIDSVAISTFGESFVALDGDDNILTYPMLYTDSRGEKEAKRLTEMFGNGYFFERFGVCPQSMYSVSKLLWIKNHKPQTFKKIDKVLLMCDYIGYILSGERIIDYALASRTGIFDLKKKEFDKKLCEELGINDKMFSIPKPTGTIVGKIKESVCDELGLNGDCVLVLGSHDQVCATIGAGAIDDGESADGMGTVECITSVFKEKPDNLEMCEYGYPVVPFINGLYCTYILNKTSNSVMSWYRKEILHSYKGGKESVFDYLEESLGEPTDILILPYFSGSGNPYNDVNAKGAMLNITLKTTDSDIYRAIMESTSYEMKYNLEIVNKYGINAERVVATGGGANSEKWVQIKSDIFEKEVKTLRSSEGGLCGLAAISSVALKENGDYYMAREVFTEYKKTFYPSSTHRKIYEKKYRKYKKIYNKIKEIF